MTKERVVAEESKLERMRLYIEKYELINRIQFMCAIYPHWQG